MDNKIDKLCGVYRELQSKGIIKNKKDFASLLSVNYSGLISAMNGDEKYLTDSLVAKAAALLSPEMLILPRGDGGSVLPGRLVPFYDVEAAAGTQYGMDMTPTTTPMALIEIGNVLNDSEMAIRVYGNSMVPNYPAGCVIGVKITHEPFIVPGSVYVVETKENRYLKRLYYSKDRNALRCISDNTMLHESGSMKGEYVYPEFDIPMSEVQNLWRVLGFIKRNIL